MTCFCCGASLVRATDIPDARWLRQGDLYCQTCHLVIWREHLADSWPAECLLCRNHTTATSKGDT